MVQIMKEVIWYMYTFIINICVIMSSQCVVCIEENDRTDTLSEACQEGNAGGDSPACPSTGETKPAEVPEFSQDAPLISSLN